MAANIGKVFEESIKKSMPDYALLIRLPDPPQAFTKRSDTRFSHKNPCDYICFDTNNKVLLCLELKTTKHTSISFEDINNEDDNKKMIHRHQILGLEKYSMYDNVNAGFLFNFRHFEDNKEKYFETTYYQSIEDFLKMTEEINKKSFNEIDLIKYGNAIKVQGAKKVSRWYWDIDSLLQNINKECE